MRRLASRPVTLAIVLACLAGTLALGTGHKLWCTGANWSDGRQYRVGCYTDLIPLFSTEQLSGGRLPYLDPCTPAPTNCDEYPVLTMYLMRVAGWLSADHLHGFFWANAALLAIAAAATAVCLYLLDPRRALWFALAPSLALEAFLNWDLLAVSLAAAGTLAFFRRRDGWAGALLGLGAAAKLYPALLLVPFAADRLRARQPDAAIRLWWSAAAAWVLVNAPFAIGGPRGWWEFFRFNAARPLDWDSLWTLACRLSACASIPVANVIGVVATAAITVVIWAEKRRREPEFPRWQLVFPLLIAFLLTGKVYSPQFSLWLLPWFALVEGDVRRFVAFEVADVAVFFTRLSFFAGYTGFGGAPRWVFEVAVVIRASVLLWCIVAWVRRPTRSLPPERSPVPVVAA